MIRENHIDQLYDLKPVKKSTYKCDTITSSQVDVVKKFITICGFHGFMDYTTKICAGNITDEVIKKLNKIANEICDLFPVHEVNLNRTNGKFSSSSQVMSILRTLLSYIGIRWKSIRTKKSIYIMIVSEEINNYDRCVIKHKEYIMNCTDCEPLYFTINTKEHMYTTPDDYNLIVFESGDYKWLLLNTKKLKIIDCPKELSNCHYYIFAGNNIIHHGKINDDNLYPTKYVPFKNSCYHEIKMIINCGKNKINNINIKFKLTPFKHSSDNADIHNVVEIPWTLPNCVLRFFFGMCVPSESIKFIKKQEQFYLNSIIKEKGVKILDCDLLPDNGHPNQLIFNYFSELLKLDFVSVAFLLDNVDLLSIKFIITPLKSSYLLNLSHNLLYICRKTKSICDIVVTNTNNNEVDTNVNISIQLIDKINKQKTTTKKFLHKENNYLAVDDSREENCILLESLEIDTKYSIKITFGLKF